MRRSQNHLDILLLGFISIVHKQLEDSNNQDRDLKAKIYYSILKTILKQR